MPIGPTKTKAQKQKVVHQEMHKFKEGDLHSGSKKGPVVKSRKQAIAIALSESHQSNRNTGKHAEQPHPPTNPGFYDNEAHPEAEYRKAGENFRPGSERANKAVAEAHENIHRGKGMQPVKPDYEHFFVPPHSPRAHGFGHGVERRDGALRLSGVKGAHQIGKRS